MSAPRHDASAAADAAPNLATPNHTEPSQADVSGQSVGQLLSDVTRDLSTLMRQELELAKAEIKTEVTKAGKGAGMLGGAGFAGYMLVLFLSFAAWWGLANVMDIGWAALIVAVVWGVIAAALAVLGRSTLKQVNPRPDRTLDTAKQIPPALKPNA